jgi:pimeloyl-ACP methyl ester carboxylesterase
MKGRPGIAVCILSVLLLALISCTNIRNAGEMTMEADVLEPPSVAIEGWWEGYLSLFGDSELLLQFEVVDSPNGYSSFLSILQQGVRALAVNTTSYDGTTGLVSFDLATIQASYTGLLDSSTSIPSIRGTFSQGGAEFPLVLEKKHTLLSRTQDVVAPYPYISEEVTIPTEGGFSLSGTLTRPDDKAKHPAVILVSGSGLQNRDEEIFGHKPFLVLSDALTKAGIATLRYDDRGFGQSGGNGLLATTYDFADDAKSAYEFLQAKEYIQQDRVGVIGHSEGAIISGILAATDPSVSFIVLLSGPGLKGVDLILQQARALLEEQGIGGDQMETILTTNRKLYMTALDYTVSEEDRKLSIQAMLLASGYPSEIALQQTSALLSPWYLTYLELDPVSYFSKVSCPTLIISGTKDLQVPSKGNVEALQKALSLNGNAEVTVQVLPGLNHLLQSADTGQPSEYASIEMTMDPSVLDLVPSWILSLVK